MINRGTQSSRRIARERWRVAFAAVNFTAVARVCCAAPFAAVLALVFAACGGADATRDVDAPIRRLVVAGGAAGELAVALGRAQDVVGVDLSAARAPGLPLSAPRVGYVRSLPVEGLAALRPDLVLATAEAGPPEALEQLRALGVRVVLLPDGHGLDGALERIAAAGDALFETDRAIAIAEELRRESTAVRAQLPAGVRPTVLWVLQPGGGAPLVGGSSTAADGLIREAGGENAAAALEGWKPMSVEALWAAAPEVIVVASIGTTPGKHGHGSLAKLWPALADSPAARTARVVALEPGALSGGPRHGEHLAALARAIHPSAAGLAVRDAERTASDGPSAKEPVR